MPLHNMQMWQMNGRGIQYYVHMFGWYSACHVGMARRLVLVGVAEDSDYVRKLKHRWFLSAAVCCCAVIL